VLLAPAPQRHWCSKPPARRPHAKGQHGPMKSGGSSANEACARSAAATFSAGAFRGFLDAQERGDDQGLAEAKAVPT